MSSGEHVRLLSLTETFMTTAQVLFATPCVASPNRQLTSLLACPQDVHTTLRAIVAQHTPPQPFMRTANLVSYRRIRSCVSL